MQTTCLLFNRDPQQGFIGDESRSEIGPHDWGRKNPRAQRLPRRWINSYFVASVDDKPVEVVKDYVENQRYGRP